MIKVRKKGKFAIGAARRQVKSSRAIARMSTSLSGGRVRQASRTRRTSTTSRGNWIKSSYYKGFEWNKSTGQYRKA